MNSLWKAREPYMIWLFSVSSHCTHFSTIIKHSGFKVLFLKVIRSSWFWASSRYFLFLVCSALFLTCCVLHPFSGLCFWRLPSRSLWPLLSRNLPLSSCHSTPFSRLLLSCTPIALCSCLFSYYLSPYQGFKDHVCFNCHCLPRIYYTSLHVAFA